MNRSKIWQCPLDFHLPPQTPPPPPTPPLPLFLYLFSCPVCLLSFFFYWALAFTSVGKVWGMLPEMDSGTRFSLEFLGQLYMVLRQYMPLYLRPVCIVAIQVWLFLKIFSPCSSYIRVWKGFCVMPRELACKRSVNREKWWNTVVNREIYIHCDAWSVNIVLCQSRFLPIKQMGHDEGSKWNHLRVKHCWASIF